MAGCTSRCSQGVLKLIQSLQRLVSGTLTKGTFKCVPIPVCPQHFHIHHIYKFYNFPPKLSCLHAFRICLSDFFCSFTFACSQNKKKQQCLTYYSFYTSYVIVCPSICHLQPFIKCNRCCHFPAAKQNATCSDQSEILVHLTTSKLVWSSGCFHLRQQCVVKWNTLDCSF